MNEKNRVLPRRILIQSLFARSQKRLVAVFFVLLTLSGCLSSLNVRSPAMLTVQPVEIYLESDPTSNPFKRLGITLFSTPSYLPGAGEEVTTIVQQELLRKSVFRQSLIIPRAVKSKEEAVYWGQKEGCDLVMVASIPYAFDGSGNQTTQLMLNVEIWDIRTSRQVWYFQQDAYCSPGADADFYWTTVAGESAARYKVLAKYLGAQMADLLTVPKETPGEGPWCLW